MPTMCIAKTESKVAVEQNCCNVDVLFCLFVLQFQVIRYLQLNLSIREFQACHEDRQDLDHRYLLLGHHVLGGLVYRLCPFDQTTHLGLASHLSL